MSGTPCITFFKPSLSHFVETMAMMAASCPQWNIRIVTSLERGSEFSEHPWSLRRLLEHPGIQVVGLDEPAERSSLVVYGLTRRAPLHPALAGWIEKADANSIYPESNGYGGLLDWVRELARSFPAFLRAKFVILERARRLFDFRFGCRRAILYTPSVHPQHLTNPSLRSLMEAPVCAAVRRFRISFVGNRQPPERSVCLDSGHRALNLCSGVAQVRDFPSPKAASPEALWIEYDTAAGQGGLYPADYIRTLDESDFCLAPPGWGQNWTHRVIEACMRGAIPVLEDPQLYNLPFEDGENCILADRGDWSGAVRRCLESSPDDVVRMQRDVINLRETHLNFDVASQKFCERIRAFLPGNRIADSPVRVVY